MKWISMEEEIPEDNTVLVYDSVEKEVIILTCGFYGFPSYATHWMPLPPPPQSSNSDYAKLPTIGAIVEELNGGKNLGWTDTDVVPIIKAIKKLGNFA